ncbi:Alpha/Beta hydrolase protein [Lyophyllum atratum]|nr:Alpha/Beta hydrolase protein [Lyophyllum atratum]
MLHVEDKTLVLPDGRTLAYADNGNTSSSSLVLFLHSAFSVGDASRPPRVLLERNVHFVAPSLPGWGRSSPVPSRSSYATTLASDITALITHLHPQTSHKLRLYLCAHSFGTVPAQMLYGLPHHTFPLGRQLAALVLLAPHSPPHCHAGYGRAMTWPGYIMAGPLARYMPFNLVMHLVRVLIAGQFSSELTAEAFMRKSMVAAMDEEERDMFVQWKEEQGVSEGQFEHEVGRNAFRSVTHSWRGFLDIPAIYHSGWGQFFPPNIESGCPVLVVSSQNDYTAPAAMAQWLASTYQSARLKNIQGSHFSAFFHLDDIWNEVFGMESSLFDN